jgi:hypothetical protein
MHTTKLARRAALALAAATALAVAPARAQTLGPEFAASYTVTDLGSVPGLPPLYGGLAFFGPNILLIGGTANEAEGRIHAIGVVRDAQQRVTGFSGSAQLFGGPGASIGTFNDGGVVFGPGGVLFTSRWPVNALGQTKPGSITEDKVIDLTALGVADSHAAINFIPPSLPGSGQAKLVSWSGGEWYSAGVVPDGSGTYDLVNVQRVDLDPVADGIQNLPGGPEGFVYVGGGNPGFAAPSMLLSEFSDGNVVAYDLDAQGNPILASRRAFVSGLTGAEGAAIDPVTGDFFFSTFGGGDRVIRVSGFTEPPLPTVPEPGAWLTMAAGLAMLALRRRA